LVDAEIVLTYVKRCYVTRRSNKSLFSVFISITECECP